MTEDRVWPKGKPQIEKGVYTDFEINNTGDLIITLTGEGKEFLKELIKDKQLNDYETLRELIDYQLCNSWDWIEPKQIIGALTDAPILGNDVIYDDQGDVINANFVWWFPDYQIVDLAEELLKEGQLIFQKGY